MSFQVIMEWSVPGVLPAKMHHLTAGPRRHFWVPTASLNRDGEVASVAGETGNPTKRPSPIAAAGADAYDPFTRGRYPVGVRTIQALDTVRNRLFPCEIWYPASTRHAGQDLAFATQDRFTVPAHDTPCRQMAVRDAAAHPGAYPLILFSHRSGGRRRQSTFLCTHLSSHGYVVAALDHSDVIAPELMGREGETREEIAARVQGWIANRVPDIRFLLDHLLASAARDAGVHADPARIGIVGHSFGGWTALAAPEVEGRIHAVVALAPSGSSQPPPNVIPATLTFAWGRDVPTLYVVAEDDTALPLAGMYELFARTRATKRMVVMRRADHGHFEDDIEQRAGWCSREAAHLCVRGLTLCHMDAIVKGQEMAQRFWGGDVIAALAVRGVDVVVPTTGPGDEARAVATFTS
jgi:dienelactone hydrolase